MEIKINQSTLSDLTFHFDKVKDDFNPPLDSIVVLSEYVCKLYQKAQRVELWDLNTLVGVIAYYNNLDNNTIFITNVSIEKRLYGKNFASKLIEKLIEICISNKIKTITLEVFKQNLKAINFYLKLNFKIESENKTIFTMIYIIPNGK